MKLFFIVLTFFSISVNAYQAKVFCSTAHYKCGDDPDAVGCGWWLDGKRIDAKPAIVDLVLGGFFGDSWVGTYSEKYPNTDYKATIKLSIKIDKENNKVTHLNRIEVTDGVKVAEAMGYDSPYANHVKVGLRTKNEGAHFTCSINLVQ